MNAKDPSTAPLAIGTDRQLFVDGYWIAANTGVRRQLHAPEKREIVLSPEKPWEMGGLSYLSAFEDEGKIRGWYRADPKSRDSDHNSITCYAESSDGINWRKPTLEQIEFAGSTHNNIVWVKPGINFALLEMPIRQRSQQSSTKPSSATNPQFLPWPHPMAFAGT